MGNASAKAIDSAVSSINRSRLFWLAVLALTAAAMSAALRSAIASSLKAEWIDPIAPVHAGELIGSALGSAFLGFATTLFIASAFLDQIGMRRVLIGCGVSFLVGTVLIVSAGALAEGMTIYYIVWAGILLSGVGWGLAEAAINPLTAQLYPEDTTHRLNVLHAWYPGGMIIGGLAGVLLAGVVPWKGLMAIVILPSIAVIVIALTTRFPDPVRATGGGTSFGDMIAEVFRRPSFFIWFGAMFLTASSELAPGQWLDVALTNRVGMRGILLLVYVSALMFIFRHFMGRIAARISNPGLLWMSSLLAAIGLFMLSRAETPASAIIASTVWGLGVCAMWPTMLASVSERYPRGGAWALGLVGSAGALAQYFVLPRLGEMFDEAKIQLAGGVEAFEGLSQAARQSIENSAASISFERLALVPVVLLFVFGGIWLVERRKNAAAL